MYSFVKVKYIIQNITEYMYNLFVENSINERLAKQDLLSSFFSPMNDNCCIETIGLYYLFY